jgi:RNA polymerase sigma-70 factor (ECF subfamily)
MKKTPDEFIPTRASLLGRLKDWQDEESWREFFNIYRQLIFSFAIKSGLTEAEAEDVVQETVISVAKTIKEFEYDPERCRFKSWLRHLTQKRIADCFRKRPREQSLPRTVSGDTARTAAMERVPSEDNLESIWEEEWQKRLLDAAIERVKTQVSAEQYQMFDFYVLKKMPARKVTAALGTSVGQLYLAKHRISKLIKKEVRRLEEKMG